MTYIAIACGVFLRVVIVGELPVGETTVLLEGQGFVDMVVGGDTLIYLDTWSNSSDIHRSIDIATEEMVEPQVLGELKATDGKYLVTQEIRPLADDRFEHRLWEQNLDNGFRLLIDGPRWTTFPVADIADRIIAWSTGSEIHAMTHTSLLPTTPQPDPGTTDPAWLYFPETGHYLSHGFKDFWRTSGGLPVFGYPLTAEFEEQNPDLGENRVVQYTERQRFEYHPALAGTPYETLLGRLGYADAARQGLLDHLAFQPLPADTATDSDTDFFPVFGHTLSNEFRDFWHSHGLDFGDRGVSYRESLALFGYPISEEFVDPDTGLATQYFERAVFEYHPDNPDPHKVLLRRLGAEELNRRGW